ncbi:hypothetical protein Gasu2_68550 [Galdieria sulphuraria]|nr:hypothetical protein Gasu2_68550 [Galdieria sulphuraria]
MSASERAVERRRRILNSSSQRLKLASGSALVSEDKAHNVEKETSSPVTPFEDKENLSEESTVTKATQQDVKDAIANDGKVPWEQKKCSSQSDVSAVPHTSNVQRTLDRFSIIRRASEAFGLLGSSKDENLFRPVCFVFMGVLLAVTLCATSEVSKIQLVYGMTWLTPLKSVSFFTWFIAVELAVNTTKIISSFSGTRNSRDLLCGLFGFLGYLRWFSRTTV